MGRRRVVGRRLGRHGDGDVGVRLDGRELDGRAERAVAGRQGERAGLRRRLGVRDAHDVGERAAVVEVAVDGVRQHRARGEAAVELLELRPVRDQPRLLAERIGRVVARPLGGEPDEGGDGGRAGGERGDARRHLLHVDARGQVGGRHGVSLLSLRGGVALATRGGRHGTRQVPRLVAPTTPSLPGVRRAATTNVAHVHEGRAPTGARCHGTVVLVAPGLVIVITPP